MLKRQRTDVLVGTGEFIRGEVINSWIESPLRPQERPKKIGAISADFDPNPPFFRFRLNPLPKH